jgi:hypothetical protein
MPYRTLFSIRWRHVVLLPVWALTSGWATAQWQWVDGTGRKVFSDTPPPASVSEKQILKRPGVRSPAPVDAAPAPAESLPAAPRLPARDEQLEARKKQAEEAEQAKKKAEDERLVKARAESCERAKRAKATMDSGIRIATTNAKGEREIMDDKARAQENQRIDEIMRADCAPAVN